MLVRAWLLVFVLAACVNEDGPRGPEVTSRVQRVVLPIAQPKMLDVLVVVDDSPAMAPHRERLRANFGRFIDVLNTVQGGLPSLHLGVVTTDVGGCNNGDGEGGRMRTSARVDGTFISDVRYQSAQRVRNYDGDLRDVFTELADAGSDGCVYARPLDAIRLALDNPANAGFVRDDAFLAVIVITATDDCSSTPAFTPMATTDPAEAAAHCYVHREDLVDVGAAADALRARHADPSKVVVVVISGPPDPLALQLGDDALELGPACNDEMGGAIAAPRLGALRDAFPNRSTYTSLCRQDLTDGLTLFAAVPVSGVSDPCFEAPLLDLAPSIDGVQPECSVVDELPDGTQRSIPSCDTGADRCWSIVPDAMSCPPLGQRLDVTPLDEPYPPGLRIVAECVSA